MMRKLFLMILVSIILCSCAVAPQELPKLYKQNILGVVTVHNNANFSYGSGFVIDKEKGLVVTAAHIVKQNKSFTIEFCTGFEVLGVVKSIDYENDIAVIEIGLDFYAWKLLPDFELETNPIIGEFIFSIGSPGDFEGTVSLGVLSRNLVYADDFWVSFPLGFYVSDIHIFSGSSGSPVFNLENKIVGMVVGYVGSYSVIVPAGSIEKFLKQNAN